MGLDWSQFPGLNRHGMAESATEDRPGSRFRFFSDSPYLWVFLVALVMRFVYCFQSMANPLFGATLVDAEMYDNWANQIVAGKWLWDGVGIHTPVYPYFLAGLKLSLGNNWAVVRFVQVAMGALSAVLMGKIAERLWNRTVGITTAALLATNWMLVIQDGEEYAECFAIFFQSLALWFIVCGPRTTPAFFAAGLSFALSAGARPNLLLCLPLIAVWIASIFWGDFEHVAGRLAAWGLGIALVFAPILLRNHQLSGAWILRSMSTWNFYAAVAPEFEGFLHPTPGVQYDKYVQLSRQSGVRSAADAERFWWERTCRIVGEEPRTTIVNFFKRCLLFLNRRDWSQDDFDAVAYRSYSGLRSLAWPHAWLVIPLGLVGMAIGGRGSRDRGFELAYSVMGMISVALLKASSRYRLPTIVLLSAFAAAAIWHLAQWARDRQWQRLTLPVCSLILVAGIAWPDWLHLRERQTARHWFAVGLWKSKAGRYDEALAAFRRSATEFPQDADSPYQVGVIFMERGDSNEARKWFDEALVREPRFPEALTSLAWVDLEQGDFSNAEKRAHAALELHPGYQSARLVLARVRRMQGRTADELAIYETLVQEYGDPSVAINLALRLEELGRNQDALSWCGRVFETDACSGFDRARAGMLAGYILARKLNQAGPARDFWRGVAQRFPSETFFLPQALFLSGRIDEKDYQRRVGQSPTRSVLEFECFNLGLARRLGGDVPGACQAFEQCLKVETGTQRKPSTDAFLIRWSMEELAASSCQSGRSTGNARPDRLETE